VLDAARAEGAPPELIAAAAAVLRQPTAGLAHDDHMHVRLYCAPGDRPLGCTEVGTLRWFKKGYKYRADQLLRAARALAAGLPRVGACATPGLPVRGFVSR
jgi:penicillin-insensitive murein endopeptidase